MHLATVPEVTQRQAVARGFNQQLAQRRLLDRETYRGLRQYVRIPVDAAEKARTARWDLLTYTLQLARKGHIAAWIVASNVQSLRQQRAVQS